MIKKVFKGLLGMFIIGFGIINFSSAGQTVEVGLDWYVSPYDSNYSSSFLKGGGVLSQLLGNSKSVVAFKGDVLFWRTPTGKPYLYVNNQIGQGYFNYFYSCSVLTGLNSVPTNCTRFELNDLSILSNFFGKVKAGDYVYYDYGYPQSIYWRNSLNICWSSSEIGNSICFNPTEGSCNYNNAGNCGNNLSDSLNLDSTFSFGSLTSSMIGSAPGVNNSFVGGTGSFNNSGNNQLLSENVDTIINFYESRYGFNENICYVGTDDLVTEFGSGGLSFELGTGGTIFSMYNQFYTGGDLNDVGTFIDVWQLNYSQRFYNRNNPDSIFYLVTWDGPGTNVKVQYDNLEFPFVGKPAALYFMTNHIYDNSIEFQMGDEIVAYCYAKLNSDNLQNGSFDFDNYYNSLPDYIRGNIGTYTNYKIETNNGYLVPDTEGGSTNMWNYVISTGSGIPEDLQPSNLFVGFYNSITDLVKNYNPFSRGLLPDRIVYPLIFLVLFRILKH